MKKITLFIAFLAISIGAVWGQQANEILTASNVVVKSSTTNLPEINQISACTINPTPTSETNDDYEYFRSFSFTATNGDISSLINKNCTISVTVGTGSQARTFDNITSSVTNQTLKFDLGQNVNFTKNDALNITITWPSGGTTLSDDVLWDTTLTLTGSRKVHHSLNGNDYIIHTGTYTASLEKFNKSSQGNYYISDVLFANKGDISASTVEGGLYAYYTIDGFNFTINRESQPISVTSLGSTAFDGFTISNNSAFLLPATIHSIGNSNDHNKCFNFQNSGSKKVLVIFNYTGQGSLNQSPNGGYTIPTFYSKEADFSDLVGSQTFLMLGPSASFSYDDWNGDAVCKFADKGKSWQPFQINVTSMEKIGSNINITYAGEIPMTDEQKYIEISQFPFSGINLKVELTGVEYGSHDGSWCKYNVIDDVFIGTDHLPSSIADDKLSFSYSVNSTLNLPITVKLLYVNNLIYSKGKPFFNIAADQTKVVRDNDNAGDPILCYRSKGVYFRFKDNNDNVPYWMYTNEEYTEDGTTHTAMETPPCSLTIGCPVYVEKEITSEHYRYFSLPFDCNVNDIKVYKIESGAVTNKTIPLLAKEPDNWDTINTDYFVINRYDGQQDENAEGSPKYEWIGGGELNANTGYAFALVEAEVGNDINALITFKSKENTNKMYLNTYSGLTIPVENRNSRANLEQNRGWNMIGNPFYHYLLPTSFYGDNADGTSHPIKYISLIEDNDNETVHHYWVNEQKNYSNPNGDNDEVDVATKIPYIKPFQAFFVQVSENCTTMTVYPQDADFTYLSSTPTEQENQAVSRIPAEEEEIQEHLSVKVTGQDGSFDRTTVINDESRDEHFKMMDDLAKIMNPGVQIYTWYDSVPCAFKELPMRADSTMAIPLGVRVAEAGNYTFALDTNLTFFYGAAMLHDKQMNQYHPLNEDGVQVSLTEGTDNARFELVIVPSEIPADVENVETSETLDAYVHDGRLVVENIENGSTLSIYDISGRLLYSAPAAGDFSYRFSAHGVYMVVLQGNTTGSIKVVY